MTEIKILITGATGNVGMEVMRSLQPFIESFNIDVRDVGAVAARVLTDSFHHVNKSYELTCSEKLTFKEMAQIITSETGAPVRYVSPNLLRFYWTKRKEKIPYMLILVMIMLHYFPRFQKSPLITNWVEKITGKKPFTFERFVIDHKKLLAVRV